MGGVGLAFDVVGNAVGEDSDAKLGRNFLLQQMRRARSAVFTCQDMKKPLTDNQKLLIFYKAGLTQSHTRQKAGYAVLGVRIGLGIDID